MGRYRREIFICTALFVLTVLVFGQIQGHEFIAFGDSDSIAEIPPIRNGWSVDGLVRAFTGRLNGQWQPLTSLSHMTDVELFGIAPGAHHLVGLFFHITNSLLLFLVFRRMSAAVWQSAFLAALFALHPLHVEPVVWVAARRELLFGLAWILALWAYARYAERPGRLRYLPVLGLFLLGAMATPMMATLPIVLILMDYWPLGRLTGFFRSQGLDGVKAPTVSSRQALLEKAGYLLCFLIAGFLVIRTIPALKTVDFYGSWASSHTLAAALVSYVAYIRKMLWPVGLTLSYPVTESVPFWQAVGSGVFLAVVSAAVIRWGRSRPYLPMGWFWYLVTVTPVVGLIPFGPDRIAERYAYIPMVGLFVMVAWGLPDLLEKLRISKKWMTAAAGLILAACMITAQAQTARWKNSYVLFSHLVKTETNDPRLYFSFGVAAMQEENFEEAIHSFQEAIRIDPRNTAARNQLGILLAQEGRVDEAQGYFKEAIQMGSKNSETTYNYGLLLMQQGNLEAALRQFEATLDTNPENEGAHNALGVLLTDQGRYEDARRHFNSAIRIAPRRPEAEFNLGLAYMYEGKIDEAKNHYQKALAIDPDHAKAHLYLAKLLVRERDLEGAFTHFNEVLRINPNDGEAQHAVGVLLYERGDKEGARRHVETALQLNPDNSEARRLLADMDNDARPLGIPKNLEGAQVSVTKMDESHVEYQQGVTMVRDGRLDEAKKVFEKILKKNSRHPGAHYNLGVINERQKKLDEAVSHFQSALEITPEDGQIHNNLGAVMAQQGRFDDAIAQFSKALRINPEDAKARQNLALAQQFKKKSEQGN